MINKLAQQIQDLNLIHYKNLTVRGNDLFLCSLGKSFASYQMLNEVSSIIELINKEKFNFHYDDDNNKLKITLK